MCLTFSFPRTSGGAVVAALNGIVALFQGLSQSPVIWEEDELFRFLSCVASTPPPKRSKSSASTSSNIRDGGWVLDCFVAERYYDQSCFRKNVYRTLRVKAEKLGFVETVRRDSPTLSSGTLRPPVSQMQEMSTTASTTSVPLLVRLTPAGRDHLAFAPHVMASLHEHERDSPSLLDILRWTEQMQPASSEAQDAVSFKFLV